MDRRSSLRNQRVRTKFDVGTIEPQKGFYLDVIAAVDCLARKRTSVQQRRRRQPGDPGVWIVQTALAACPIPLWCWPSLSPFSAGLRLSCPDNIFPNINIPVISVVWTYNGLLPNDMSSRVIYYYERTRPRRLAISSISNSQSLNSYGVVKIFFQKNVNISAASQVTAASQTVLKLLPPGITPPYVLSYNASSVPILQLALSSNRLPQMKLFDLGQNFIRPQLATVAGAAIPSPYGGKVLQVQVDLTIGHAGAQRVGRRRQYHLRAEPDSARRRSEARQIRLERLAQCQPDGARSD